MTLKKIVDVLTDKGANFCDIRKERWESTLLTLKDGKIERMVSGEEEGAMVRVLFQNGWGCVGTSALERLNDAAERALGMAKQNDRFKSEETGLASIEPYTGKSYMPAEIKFEDVSFEEKMSFMDELHGSLQRDHVKTIDIHYKDSVVQKEIVNSEGTHVEMQIPRLITYMIITGKNNGRIQQASEGVGGTGGYELKEGVYEKVDTVLNRLHDLLEAEAAPSGKLPLIMDHHLTGVFVHEAFGHAAEADLVVSGNSCLENKLGEMVAGENVTIIDDPTFPGYGSFPYDDEGTKTRRRVLVDAGKLNDYIMDRESAWKLGLEPNGGARAEDFRVKPIVRMSNTLLKARDMKMDELLEGVDRGIYARSSSGGQVSPAQGTFQFNAQVAYLIEDGELTKPLRDVSFSGFTLDTLKNIVGITDEMKTGVGHCGKGQTAAVSDGGPQVLISEVTVGGR